MSQQLSFFDTVSTPAKEVHTKQYTPPAITPYDREALLAPLERAQRAAYVEDRARPPTRTAQGKYYVAAVFEDCGICEQVDENFCAYSFFSVYEVAPDGTSEAVFDSKAKGGAIAYMKFLINKETTK